MRLVRPTAPALVLAACATALAACGSSATNLPAAEPTASVSSANPLAVSPIRTTDAGHGIPFSYPIAIGVRRGGTARCVTMQHELDRHRAAIARILRSYHVPLAPDARADAPSHQGDSCGTH